jgi:1,4-dihydroxy-2-naphthoate octaprenyltransferase
MKARDIVKLARFHFLVPGILLYILGAMLATVQGYELTWDKFFFGYAIFGLAHLSVSFSNDYFDREGDSGSEPTALSGGSGVLVQHPELAPLALRMALVLLLASGVLAVAFTLHYDYPWTFLVFALMGGWLGWFYTAPPVKFAYRGLGEVSTAIAAGLVMPGMGYFVISGALDAWFLALTLPLVCYGLFFILTVEMPDVEVDAVAGKRNMLVRFGRRGGAWISVVACALGTLGFLLIYQSGALGREVDFGLIALFSLVPLAVATVALLRFDESRGGVVRQVKLNFGSMMGFLILTNTMLALQVI